MKVLIVEPGKHPYEAEIDSSLESLQKTVGGYIEAIYPFEDMVALISDEEAKLESDTQWNRILGGDIIKGTFFLCGIEGENFCDLPDDLMEKYKKYFWVTPYSVGRCHEVTEGTARFVCQGILRRASVRGKELPEVLRTALKRQACACVTRAENA